MKAFLESKRPFTTSFVMDKNADDYESALMITDGEILAQQWRIKHGCKYRTKVINVVVFMYALWYDEITGIINRRV